MPAIDSLGKIYEALKPEIRAITTHEQVIEISQKIEGYLAIPENHWRMLAEVQSLDHKTKKGTSVPFSVIVSTVFSYATKNCAGEECATWVEPVLAQTTNAIELSKEILNRELWKLQTRLVSTGSELNRIIAQQQQACSIRGQEVAKFLIASKKETICWYGNKCNRGEQCKRSHNCQLGTNCIFGPENCKYLGCVGTNNEEAQKKLISNRTHHHHRRRPQTHRSQRITAPAANTTAASAAPPVIIEEGAAPLRNQ